MLLFGNLGDGDGQVVNLVIGDYEQMKAWSASHRAAAARVPANGARWFALQAFVKIGPTSGCYPRIPFGVLGLISKFGSRGAWLSLRLRLLFATMFRLKPLPQFALNAGMRCHDLTIRLCQSF